MSNSALIAIASLFAAAAVPAGAEQWDVTKDKSLVVHRLAATDLRMTVVCDPEGAFSPPQNYLFVERRGQRVETGQLTVSEGDESVNLPIIGAAAVPTGNVENWNRGMDMLFGGRGVNVAVGEVAAQLQAERIANVCTAR